MKKIESRYYFDHKASRHTHKYASPFTQDNLHSGILCCELKSINGRMERVMEKFLETTRLSIIKIQSGSERYSQGYLGSGF